MTLSHRERLQACLADSPALDRPPVALWRHFPMDDQSPETLAAATLAFQRQHDFDLVKVTPASSFCLKDWGAEDVWEGHTEGTRRYVQRAISKPQDWEHLPVLSPFKAPYLAGQLACLRLIRAGLPSETPLLQTIFSPLAQAKNLAGGVELLAHIRQHPEAVLKGLAAIAETTRQFIEAALDTGIDGIFFAVQHAQAGELTLEEYKNFGLPNDMKTLDPAKSLWCNLLHLHGLHVYFNLVSDYASFPIVNWHDRETPPALIEAQKRFGGAVCGGVSQHTVVLGSSSQVRAEAGEAIANTKGRRLILGTGCVAPVIAPYGNIVAVRQSVEMAK
ncbi:MAG: uroporphyrinogen decarboxylase [Chloroflexi bacterium]|nr:uroporphyrinogen decarboxylase [Chloroflexota bacterium]